MYTISSARYANEENTAAVVETEEAGAVALSAVDTPAEWQVLLNSGVSVQAYAPPTPPRRLVKKSVIIQRLIAADLIGAARTALDADTSAYARWWAPDKPEIYFDDPDALALLQAIGADPAVILAE